MISTKTTKVSVSRLFCYHQVHSMKMPTREKLENVRWLASQVGCISNVLDLCHKHKMSFWVLHIKWHLTVITRQKTAKNNAIYTRHRQSLDFSPQSPQKKALGKNSKVEKSLFNTHVGSVFCSIYILTDPFIWWIHDNHVEWCLQFFSWSIFKHHDSWM